MVKRIILFSAILLIVIVLFNSCFYDKSQQQYPAGTCDTTQVSYNTEIMAILDASCQGCHKGPSATSGINLYDYTTIKSLALDGKYTYGSLLSSVSHEGGNPNPMPQGANKLQECDINKIRAWVKMGAPAN